MPNMQQNISFIPLSQEHRPGVSTGAAAFYLSRQQQTLREWHCRGKCPPGLTPTTINGRLSWPVEGIRRALGVS